MICLNLGRLTRLDGHRQSENPLRTGLDPTGIDPRLNQPAPGTLERLDMGELMGHVSHRSIPPPLSFRLLAGRGLSGPGGRRKRLPDGLVGANGRAAAEFGAGRERMLSTPIVARPETMSIVAVPIPRACQG